MLDKKSKKYLCLIDLDTVMQGSLLYDYGDALRYGASICSEEETDISKINIDLNLFRAFTRGFLEELKPLNSIENNKSEIQDVKEDIHNLRLEIMQHYKDQEVKEVAHFDNLKMIITAIVATLAALSTLSLWLEPSIRTLLQVFF